MFNIFFENADLISFISISFVVLLKVKPGIYGYGEWEFDSGEGALELATSSMEGSRRVIYPIKTIWGSEKM